MIVFGIGLGFIGYTLTFWGYSLVKGYDVSFKEIISPTGYYKGTWPPPTAPNNVIFPAGGNSPGSASSGSGIDPTVQRDQNIASKLAGQQNRPGGGNPIDSRL